MLYTTLKLLRKNSACLSGMETLIASLPKTQAETKQISLAHILKSNGLDHAIWALRATTVDARKYAARMSIDFALECLTNFEKVYPNDKRPRSAVEAAGLFLDGKITLQEFAVWSAVWSAEFAVWSAEFAVWSAEFAARSAEFAARFAEFAAEFAEFAARSAEFAAESAEFAAEFAEFAAEFAEFAVWSAVWSAEFAAEFAEFAAKERNAEIFLKWIRKAKP